jgi:Tol biopolymer transport system component/DNA-binding winged helix-turn-helix (wHTH) protein
MVKAGNQLYRFGKFQIDAVKRVLLCEDAPVPLPPKAFEVLLVLVEHNQRVLGKDELMSLVWGERVVEENNLTRHISTLRKVLGESPNDHHYIVTVPGRGYSFVAPVIQSVPPDGAQSAVVQQNGNDPAPHSATAQPTKSDGFERGAQTDLINQTTPAAIAAKTFGLSKPRPWVLALLVILASTGLLAFKFFNTRAHPTALHSYRDWEIVRLTRTGGSALPAISRDGKYVAYVNLESGRESVWLLQLATAARQQIVPPEQVSYADLHFTPDGSELYFTRREGALPVRSSYRLPALGGVAKKLRDDLDSPAMLSADGAHLAFARRNGAGKSEFVSANADGVEERVLTRQNLQSPAWSPDGKLIAYSVGSASSGAENMSIHTLRLADGTTQELARRKWSYVGNKVWLPDGSGLIVCARDQQVNVNRLWFVAYPSGEARPLSSGLDGFNSPSLTGDARMLVTEQVTLVAEIWSSPLTEVASAKKIGVWGSDGLCFTPDGRIIYSSIQAGEACKIWLMNADGTGQKQLTTGSSNDISVAASPDGRYLVFASNRSGNFEIWRMNLDGGNLVQLTNSKGANPPSISPDGKWVIYLSTSDNSLYRVPIEGGAPVCIAGKAVGAAAVSPDGKLIAYFIQGKNAWEIAVNTFADGSFIKQFEVGPHALNNTVLKWTPDGGALLYAKRSDGSSNIWRQPLDGSAPQQVTDFKADGMFRFDVSSDGKRLICARGGWKHDIVLIKNLR